MIDLANILILAAAEGGGESDGSFLVKPGIGLMIWTLVAFGILLLLLRKLAFPKIAENLDKRQRAIEESIDTAERTKTEAEEILAEYRQRLQDARQQAEEILARARKAADNQEAEADEILAEYRQRLTDARQQAEEILARARKAADNQENEAKEAARAYREEHMEQTRREIEAETRRAIQEIRNEVADLTVLATEKVTRKSLTEDDQRRLVDEALSELDFDALAGDGGRR